MVSDALVEEIRARADLVEICGEHTTLKRVGKSHRGPCPLHGGEGANFSVDAERGVFKCFVCGEGGDVFSFVMKQLGLDFPGAVRQIASKVGIEVPDREEAREDPYRHLREVLAFAAEWFADRLAAPEGMAARRHLQERGIDDEAVARYGLGYAPDEWRALREGALERGIEERHLLELGLLATSERADQPYDRFRDRLMFPILDVRDRPIGFGGRILGSVGDEVPKYINSPDSPVFHKRKTLYGLGWARHAIRRDGYAALVEGYTDVLAMHLHGLPIAVASLGTAFTPEQAGLLARYTKQLYLLYDSDDAGLRATFRTGDVLLAAEVHPLVVTLPAGEDPDSILRARGTEPVLRLLHDAVDLLERKLQILDRGGYLERIEGRRRAIDGLLSTLRAVRDPALRDIYLDRVAERIGVRRETLVHQIAAESRPRRARSRELERAGSDGAAGAPRGVERQLALLLVRDPSLVSVAVGAGVAPEQFSHPGIRALFAAMTQEEGTDEEGRWLRGLEPRELELVEALLADSTELADPTSIFDASIRRLIHRPQLERLREIDREIELAEETQARELLREKQRIADELRESGVPLSFLRHRTSRAGAPGR